MNINKQIFLISVLALSPISLNAQETLSTDSLKVINFKRPLRVVQNKDFYVLGTDSTKYIYNMSGRLATTIQPKVWTIAPMLNRKILYYDGKHVRINELATALYTYYTGDPSYLKVYSKKLPDDVSQLVYSPDGSFFLVVTRMGHLMKCSTLKKDKKQRLLYNIQLDKEPTKVVINKNANTALYTAGKVLNVINLERGILRGNINFDSSIRDVAFSEDYTECAVLLEDGKIYTVDISTIKNNKIYNVDDEMLKCRYILQGKYLALTNNENVKVLNLLTGKTDYVMADDNKGLIDMDVVLDSKKSEWMVYYNDTKFKALPLSLIERFHKMDLKKELNLRMAEWSKIRPGESEVDYRKRVNDETRKKYAIDLERELVTQMAGNKLESENAKFGSYIESNQALSIDFDGMPSIYLSIPADELVDIKTIEDLEFFNTVYGLTEDDKFEVIYTEARNKNTGKVYIYDNLNRKGITFDSSSFVPMEVVQLASIESAKLEKIKQEELDKAKQENILSDHTHISVSTDVEQDIDADGNKILNYNVNYQYDVEEEYSSRDDFKAGRYNTGESNAALQMIKIIKKSIEGDFAKYTKDSKSILLTVTGSADALPINGKLKYEDDYGDIEDLLIYQDGELSSMTVTKSKGITSNEELAMVRAYGMADYLKSNVFDSITIPMTNKYNITVSEEEGGKYRRIKVSIKFIDTFKNKAE